MRISLLFISLFIVVPVLSSEKPDSIKPKLIVSGNVSFNSNGMAPIPSFSLGKPALIGSFALTKKRFSYDPSIAFGLNLRPWIFDNWLHYRLINRPSFEFRTGVDFAMFFSEYGTEENRILQGQQYITFEIAVICKFSPLSNLSIMYWNDNGQDPGSIRGSYYNLVYERSDIKIGKSILLSTFLQLFCVDYEGRNDGWFVSPRVASSVKDIPLSVFFQATQAIISNIEPFPGFRWNAGLAYFF